MLKKLPVFLIVVFAGFAVIAILNKLFFADRAVISLSQPSGGQAIAPSAGSGQPGPSAAMPVPGSNVKETVVNSNAAVVITYTDNGFSPSSITIKTGETVTFKNESSRSFWPASNNHPDHTLYDGTTRREHCQSGASGSFDACKGIASGGSWSFTFSKVGSWSYHDHMSAGYGGTVVVR